MARSDVLRAIAATVELCGGRPFTPAAAAIFADDLAGFDERAVLGALTRCRKELDGKPLTVAAVVSRLDDGRPGPQEAWSLMPTEEMCKAWAVAQPLLDGRGNIPARMAFIEAYSKAVTLARDECRPAKWTPSLGHDVAGREEVLRLAVTKGRMQLEHARTLMPRLEAPAPAAQQLLSQVNIRRIA
jgi:hypothetical protein